MRLSKSVVGKEEVEAIQNVILEDGYLGMGKEVEAFEFDIANYLDILPENVTCVNSGTAALHLAFDALFQKGDEILVPSFTFLSTYQAISACGLVPISCEVDKESLLIDLNDADSKITKKTKGIVVVHYASNLPDYDQLNNFINKHNLRLIEDAAHSFGSKYFDKKVGSFGDVICFSFDGIKNITSGEGGAIICFDNNFNNIVKDSRLLSIHKDTDMRFLGKRSWNFEVTRQGYRYHMSNIFAAIGRVQLKKFDQLLAPKRKYYYQIYYDRLHTNIMIKFQKKLPYVSDVPHICTIQILNGKRDELIEFLNSYDIPTGIHYKPNHLLKYYHRENLNLPITENIYKQILSLPLHPDLSINDINKVCDCILKFMTL